MGLGSLYAAQEVDKWTLREEEVEKEVKQQVESVLNVIAKEAGKVGYDQPSMAQFNAICAETADIGLVNRQFYQRILAIDVIVKYAQP